MRLKDKVAIITGSGSGIGQAVAFLFAEEGAKIGVVDNNIQGGKNTVNTITSNGGDAIFINADVSKAEDAENAIREVIKRYEKLNILHNNAGINGPLVPITEIDEKEWDRVFNINVKGIYLFSKFAIPEIIKQGGGAIINTASNMGIAATRNLSAYCASKGAVISLTRAMALDCAKYDIRVNCVCPGTIETPMFDFVLKGEKNPEQARRDWLKFTPLGRFGKPRDIANAVLFLASEESGFATGAAFVIDGARTSSAPGY